MGDQTAEFGFARDGQWHSLKIPLNRFANIDFRTLSQVFMISSAVNPTSALNLSIDNVWWEPSVARTTPENGDFGVYTETASHKSAGAFALGVQGNFFVWANTLVPIVQHPYEGSQDISLQSAPGLTWFGMAFTPNVKYNLTAFRYPGCKLEFAMKTSSSATFMLGMKSGNIDGVGQKWITFQAGSDPYGFVRDGNWHVIDIPMSDFAPEVDLFEVSQFFEILSTTSAIPSIELDDIHFTGGGKARGTMNVGIPPNGGDVNLSLPTDNLTSYRILYKNNLSDPRWSTLTTAGGDGTVKTITDPAVMGVCTQRFYVVTPADE